MPMRGAYVGLVVVAGLVLCGCTGPAAEPSPGPSVSVSSLPPSPTPSVPAKPERPEAMERDDAEGAAAAAEYFIELYPYVMATGDTAEFEAMSHRACGFCVELSEQAASIREAGEAFSGGATTVQITKNYPRDQVTGLYLFDARITQEAQTITADDGRIVLDAEREVLERRIEMGRRGTEWLMVAVAPIPEPR